MKMRRTIWGVCLLVVGSLLLVLSPTIVLAQEEKVEIDPAYSKLEGASFQFPVTLKYTGDAAKTFNLSVTGPQNWTVYITPDYPQDKMIRDIRLDPTSTVGEYIDVNAAPPTWLIPAPGEYKITLEVSSGTLKNTVQLTAVITASYDMSLATPDDLLNTTAAAGKDNFFVIGIQNLGSAPIDNITLSSDNPKGWTIEFAPGNITALNAGSVQSVIVNIKPPPKTIAGDYSITLTAGGNQITKDIQIRVTVVTPTVWGWLGVGIIILVFAGLAFVFMRFSRR